MIKSSADRPVTEAEGPEAVVLHAIDQAVAAMKRQELGLEENEATLSAAEAETDKALQAFGR
jgi:hypothetical protein